VTSTGFLLQSWKEQKHSTSLLASNRPKNKNLKGTKTLSQATGQQQTPELKPDKETEREKKRKRRSGLQEAPHFHHPKQNHSEIQNQQKIQKGISFKNQP